MEMVEETKKATVRDIRRYYCEYCGICRSKKSLIASHLLSHHKEEIKEKRVDEEEKEKGVKANTCEECGAFFTKPAHLKQHMVTHSRKRQFACPVDDCRTSYRRKDHLTRHLLQHQGKLFTCTVENCNRRFAYLANMKRHVIECHEEEESSSSVKKQHVCQEEGCGKAFKYASRLRKHEESHGKFSLSFSFKGCLHTFATKSNLNQHFKAVHLEDRPFACRMPGCAKRFPYKHVRDNHEKTGSHVYIDGDFVESDELFRSRPRGGRKRKFPTIEMLQRKRIVPPSMADSVLNQGSDYLA
ncbi:hypothetical protein GIB67_033172 [Kingdonia uniflora]|uniref:C2H2-type domain-containing protein n=1 Tax=Kingdonia uniflora TaxID=39325 RepID=A0A7J7N3A4_9MAGN|nr:hypothetical protein GIB67_033172 [Kingdonia uniflora]